MILVMDSKIFSTVEYKITVELIDLFVEASLDKHPLHIDKSYAVSKGFPDRVVHGNVLGLFLSNYIGMRCGIKDVMIIKQSINFRKTIYIGTTLELNITNYNFHEFIPGYDLNFEFKLNDEVLANGSVFIKSSL